MHTNHNFPFLNSSCSLTTPPIYPPSAPTIPVFRKGQNSHGNQQSIPYQVEAWPSSFPWIKANLAEETPGPSVYYYYDDFFLKLFTMYPWLIEFVVFLLQCPIKLSITIPDWSLITLIKCLYTYTQIQREKAKGWGSEGRVRKTNRPKEKKRKTCFYFVPLIISHFWWFKKITYHDSAGLFHENNQSLWYKHFGKSEFNMFSNV